MFLLHPNIFESEQKISRPRLFQDSLAEPFLVSDGSVKVFISVRHCACIQYSYCLGLVSLIWHSGVIYQRISLKKGWFMTPMEGHKNHQDFHQLRLLYSYIPMLTHLIIHIPLCLIYSNIHTFQYSSLHILYYIFSYILKQLQWPITLSLCSICIPFCC